MPPKIRTASWLLSACALMAAVTTVATLFAWRHFAPAADRYRELASAPGYEVDRVIADVRGPLVYGGLVTLVSAALFGWLAVAVRRPRRRWVPIVAWVAAGVGAVLLIVDLNGGLTDTGSSVSVSPRDVLGHDLAPDWYATVNAGLGIATLVLMVAGALALTRSGVHDYYRKASWQTDDRWVSFVARQRDQR